MTIERMADALGGACEEVERAIEAARRTTDRRLASPGRITQCFDRALVGR